MADRFPVFLFPPRLHRWSIAGAPLIGGQPITGPPQTAEMSTGGWWVHEYSPAIVRKLEQLAAWRAFLVTIHSGVTAIEVPVIDALQPWPSPGGRPAGETHTDLSPFADGSIYATHPINAQLAADAYMPAWPAPPVAPNQAQIQITGGAPLKGGEYFSIAGPSAKVRLHMIGRVNSVAGAVSTVTFSPPFREDMVAGTLVDFNEPRLLMNADISAMADAWPEMNPPFWAQPSLRFVEAP